MLVLRLPKHLDHNLDAPAKRTGRIKRYFARKAIVSLMGEVARAQAILRAYGAGYRLAQIKEMFPENFSK